MGRKFEMPDFEKYGCTMTFCVFAYKNQLHNITTRNEFNTIAYGWVEWGCIPEEHIDWYLKSHSNTLVFIRKFNGQGAKTKNHPWNYPLDAKFKFCVQISGYQDWQRDLSHQECEKLGFNVRNGRSDVHPFLHANADPVYMRLKEAHDNTTKEFRKFTEGYSDERWPWRSVVVETSTPTEEHSYTYDEHMKSDYWRKIRFQVRERDKHKCRHCGSGTNLVCHHITYENLGNESLDDLLTLCKRCHYNVHQEDLRRKGQRV
jgi:5-methylcytosine-specific restriction endonuclease McrA